MKLFLIWICLGLTAASARAQEIELPVGGLERDAILHVPASLPPGPAPLVVMMHGGLGSSSQARRSYGWDALAGREGFAVVYPDGVRRTWNAGGGCCGGAEKRQIADIAFLDRLIAKLIDDGVADPERIYLAGISNGGAMAYRYACEGAHAIAAVGSVSGARTHACPNPKPVSIMEIHGRLDESIPFEGGRGKRDRQVPISWPSVAETLAPFRAVADCGRGDTVSAAGVETTRWRCAEGRDVTLVAISGGGHMWPGGESAGPLASAILDLDDPSEKLDATEALWDFFAAH